MKIRNQVSLTLTSILASFGVLAIGSHSSSSFAQEKMKGDLGFRYKQNDAGKSGRCLNDKNEEGYNPQFIGVCGDLRGLKFSGADLNGQNLSGAVLDGIDLTGVPMNGANLTGVSAKGTHFTKCHMNGANFQGSDVSGSNFDRAELNGANFNNSNMSGVHISYAQMHGTQMMKTHLEGAKLEISLKTVMLEGSYFSAGTGLPINFKEAQERGMALNNKGLKDFERLPSNSK